MTEATKPAHSSHTTQASTFCSTLPVSGRPSVAWTWSMPGIWCGNGHPTNRASAQGSPASSAASAAALAAARSSRSTNSITRCIEGLFRSGRRADSAAQRPGGDGGVLGERVDPDQAEQLVRGGPGYPDGDGGRGRGGRAGRAESAQVRLRGLGSSGRVEFDGAGTPVQ